MKEVRQEARMERRKELVKIKTAKMCRFIFTC